MTPERLLAIHTFFMALGFHEEMHGGILKGRLNPVAWALQQKQITQVVEEIGSRLNKTDTSQGFVGMWFQFPSHLLPGRSA